MKWIKFSEQEPYDEQDIILYHHDRELVASAEYQKHDQCVSYGHRGDRILFINYQQDYWMPLPDKPKE